MTNQIPANTTGTDSDHHVRTTIRWSRRRLVVATAAAVVVVVAVWGGVILSGQPRGTGPTTYLKLGQTATLRDDAGNVVEMTITDAKLRTTCSDSFTNLASQPNVYVTVTMTVVTGSWSVDAANFGLADTPWPPGSLHSGSIGEDCGTDLPTGIISAGDTRHGHLALLQGHGSLPNQIAYAGGVGVSPASWTWR